MPFIIVGLAIIHKNGQVLIAERSEKDEHVEHLTWVFPGGQLKSLDLKSEIKREVKEETNLDVEINSIVDARRPGETSKNIILIYFDCTGTGQEKPGKDIKELKWVPATSVLKYFTTAVTNDVMKYLRVVEDEKN